MLALILIGAVGLHAQPKVPELPLPEEVLPGLKDILKVALEKSPQMIQSNLALAQSEANRMVATSVYYPSVSANSSYAINTSAVANVPNSESRSQGLFYSVGLSQSLFQWGAIKASVDIANLQTKIAQKQYVDAYRQLAMLVRTQYIGLISYKMIRLNSELSLKQAKKVLAIEQDKLDRGQIAEGDIIPPRLNVEEGQLTFERSTEDFNHARKLFANLSGAPELADEAIPDDIPTARYVPEKATALLDDFMRSGPDNTYLGQIYRAQIEQARLSYRITKVRLLPKFSIYASAGLTNSTTASATSVSQVGTTTESIGLSASWSIFDGFATRGTQRSALASQRISERTYKTYSESILEQARSQDRGLAMAAHAMEISNTRLALSESLVRRLEADLNSGFGTSLSVDDSKLSAAFSRQRAISLRGDFLVKWADFLSTVSSDPILNLLPNRYLSRDAK